jgi:hypothetical protein
MPIETRLPLISLIVTTMLLPIIKDSPTFRDNTSIGFLLTNAPETLSKVLAIPGKTSTHLELTLDTKGHHKNNL